MPDVAGSRSPAIIGDEVLHPRPARPRRSARLCLANPVHSRGLLGLFDRTSWPDVGVGALERVASGHHRRRRENSEWVGWRRRYRNALGRELILPSPFLHRVPQRLPDKGRRAAVGFVVVAAEAHRAFQDQFRVGSIVRNTGMGIVLAG